MAEIDKSQESNSTDFEQSDYKINNVVALTQLIGTIVDYYSFKNKLMEEEDETDKWKKTLDESSIIPTKIDGVIEKSFLFQLKKFTE